jgi:hypothetical protein
MKTIQDEINELAIALDNHDPTMGYNVVSIHKALQASPESIHLLTEEEIATIVKGQELVSLTKIMETKEKAPKKGKANLSLLDL